MFDVLVIGAGAVGASIARELAKYKLSVGVLEKENDVCEVTSMANSAIVHSGYDPEPGTLKAKLNVISNQMFDKLSEELDFEFKRIGSLTVAQNVEELEQLKELGKRAEINGVPYKILNKDETHELEPNLVDTITGALLAPTCGIVNPFEYTVALMENAMDNGVKLFLNTEVESLERVNDHYLVKTTNGVYEAYVVINAAGLNSGEVAKMTGNEDIVISPRKGEYFVLDHFEEPFINHTIFPLPSKVGKGILVTPTTHGNYLIGPNSNDTFGDDRATSFLGLKEVKMGALRLVKDIPFNQTIRSFAGLRAKANEGDFIIEEDKDSPGFINVAGIQSPGLASSPAIATYVVEIVKRIIKLEPNENFNPYRRPMIRLKKRSEEERAALINKDSRFGKIVCRCEKITEGEIVDVIRRNCGATTVRGVKKRVRPGFGKCQGGFCEPLCIKILARELGVDFGEVKYGSKKSYIVAGKSKDGE